MSATFITQEQFDEIEDCVSFLADAPDRVKQFNAALFTLPDFLKPAPPLSDMLEGQRQMALWTVGYYEVSYRQLHQLLVDALYCFDYLIPQIQPPSTADPDGLAATLSRIPAPPGPPPASALRPITHCLQAYDYHVRMMGQGATYAVFNRALFNATRKSFGQVLPRLLDFMSAQLQIAERLNLPANRLKTARDMLTEAHRHYTFGMNGMANLMAQQSRISTLIGGINQHFNLLLDLGTLRRFRADLEVIQLQATQAQRYCAEILALRRP
jgi:hypothetical protein